MGSSKGPKHHKGNGECRLLGPFALLVQGALGILALMSLVYKRHRERPQRPLLIWWYDASKQVFGSVLVHIANLLMSMLSAGQLSVENAAVNSGVAVSKTSDGYQPNPCSFYLINLAIDTTIGIGILIPLVRLFTRLAKHTRFGDPPESLQSGNYGRPPKMGWWLKQSVIYFMGLMGMKICVLIMFQALPWISRVGDWALRWTEGNERIQVAFVMLIFPVIMNAIQYYIIDSFIKDTTKEGMMQVPNEDPDEDTRESNAYEDEHSLLSDEESDEDKSSKPIINLVDHEGALKHREGKEKSVSIRSTGVDEYDPQLDGERSPGNGSGSGTYSAQT